MTAAPRSSIYPKKSANSRKLLIISRNVLLMQIISALTRLGGGLVGFDVVPHPSYRKSEEKGSDQALNFDIFSKHGLCLMIHNFKLKMNKPLSFSSRKKTSKTSKENSTRMREFQKKCEEIQSNLNLESLRTNALVNVKISTNS